MIVSKSNSYSILSPFDKGIINNKKQGLSFVGEWNSFKEYNIDKIFMISYHYSPLDKNKEDSEKEDPISITVKYSRIVEDTTKNSVKIIFRTFQSPEYQKRKYLRKKKIDISK